MVRGRIVPGSYKTNRTMTHAAARTGTIEGEKGQTTEWRCQSPVDIIRKVDDAPSQTEPKQRPASCMMNILNFSSFKLSPSFRGSHES